MKASMKALHTWWTGLAAREQSMLAVAAFMISAVLLWWLALAPALQTLRTAAPQHVQLDAQVQTMRQLAAEATALRAQRSLSYEESVRNLENSVKQTLGTAATLSISDARASLTLKAVNPDALALWLAQARINARVVPNEAHLQRTVKPAANNAVTWDGVLLLTLPARGN